jgi:hypothetical protein
MNRPLFPATLSVPSNIRNWFGLRTFQHHLVYCCVLICINQSVLMFHIVSEDHNIR